MEVFEYLSRAQGQALSSLAADLDQSPATVYRILITLEGRGLVEFDSVQQVWHVGAQAFVIGARFLRRTSLVERARPFLRDLMEATGETANLGIRQGADALFVGQVETQANIRAFFPPGTLSPLHASGIGKALLAGLDEARLNHVLKERPLERFTAFTICEPEALRRELREIRARGYAIDGEEKTLGMRCIAAPVYDAQGDAIAGVSVSGPTSRVTEDRIAPFGAAVAAAARSLSTALGAPSASPMP